MIRYSINASLPAPSILVVDDDPADRTRYRKILEDAGYSVTEAANGREAMRALDDKFYEVAVVDLAMPEMDGIEFIQTVCILEPGTRIAAISGFMSGKMLTVAARLAAGVTLLTPVSSG